MFGFQDDIISIGWAITSQIFQHYVKIWWRHISAKYVGIAVNLCWVFDLRAIICTDYWGFTKVNRDLKKYHHLQMSFTYEVIDVSLRRTTNDMVSQKFFNSKRERLILLPVKFQLHILSEIATF